MHHESAARYVVDASPCVCNELNPPSVTKPGRKRKDTGSFR